MASIQKRKGVWQVRIRVSGYPTLTKSFDNQRSAKVWATAKEHELLRGVSQDDSCARTTTLGQLIERYLAEVTPLMKSAHEDGYRLRALQRMPICKHTLLNLTPAIVAKHRDHRLKSVAAGTVIRELAYISSAINHARREWSVNITNPVQMVRKPPSPEGRNRSLTQDELEGLLLALSPVGRRNGWTKPAVQLALETAMRRGELLSLRWEYIDLERRTAHLVNTKNGEGRTVPLSTGAIQILKSLPRKEGAVVFPIKYFTLDAAFKRAVLRAGLKNFRFHDLRHMAITAMAKKLPNVIELSAVSGHKSLAMLKRYYHPNVQELAMKLG
jgi:integrase